MLTVRGLLAQPESNLANEKRTAARKWRTLMEKEQRLCRRVTAALKRHNNSR